MKADDYRFRHLSESVARRVVLSQCGAGAIHSGLNAVSKDSNSRLVDMQSFASFKDVGDRLWRVVPTTRGKLGE